MIPTITTERLTLRPYTNADWPAYRDFTASERTKFMGGPIDDEKAWGWFCNDTASWHLNGFGTLALELDGKMIGFAGLVQSHNFPEPECGWALFDGFEGKGYAVEAARASLDHAFATTDLKSIVSYVDKRNVASAAVATRLGGVLDPDAPRPENDWTDDVYRHFPKGAVQ